ncbi:MAG: hypothetical protein JST28_09150 [Acidobacteria bacterium]|nr:hypothetical protein [Acidobacteriota bacterium]
MIGELVLDVMFLLGLAAASYGFWLAWHPLGFIVGGLLVAVFSFLTAQRRSRIR